MVIMTSQDTYPTNQSAPDTHRQPTVHPAWHQGRKRGSSQAGQFAHFRPLPSTNNQATKPPTAPRNSNRVNIPSFPSRYTTPNGVLPVSHELCEQHPRETRTDRESSSPSGYRMPLPRRAQAPGLLWWRCRRFGSGLPQQRGRVQALLLRHGARLSRPRPVRNRAAVG